jgi:hypothetical protein
MKRQHVVDRRVKEPARIDLPTPCMCTVRIVDGKRYLAVQPDCKIHSELYGSISAAYPRSALPLGGGRAVLTHRRAGNE